MQGVLTPEGSSAVHVLRGVLEQPVPPVVVLHVEHGDGLEAPPAQRQDEGVTGLQDLLVPPVLLQAQLSRREGEPCCYTRWQQGF